ncbi:MAG TPA: nucleoside triphosphate pyrophosphohydrolase [Ignavibacteriaceae bacterium]|nr:nucleoside triphosphate pyrophosphohydrolase [Ignavibacteriaceae bacterium]
MSEMKFNEFVEIVKRLRKECPWDKEQTFDSIKANTIEEAYEVVEAIDNKNYEELKKELGDLLLHIIFHSTMAEEQNYFNLSEVIESIREKLIRRHPHVFGDTEVTGSEHVKKNWEMIKMKEGRNSVIDGVPGNLPALQRAHRLQEKASKVGFDWEKKEDVWKKVIEEIEEMHEIEKFKSHNSNLKNDNEIQNQLEKEIGDVFFALVNYARFLNVNPENALRRTNEKFIKRFNFVEDKIRETGKIITESNLKEMDNYWNESKKLFS